jgi:hypothetical protein
MASDIDLGRFISWLDGMARAYGYESDAALARGLGRRSPPSADGGAARPGCPWNTS